jgi:hypothetical protein
MAPIKQSLTVPQELGKKLGGFESGESQRDRSLRNIGASAACEIKKWS